VGDLAETKLVLDVRFICGSSPKVWDEWRPNLSLARALAWLNRQYNVHRRDVLTRAVDCGVSTAEVRAQR
jgi:hypothetical protein